MDSLELPEPAAGGTASATLCMLALAAQWISSTSR
jgi:hypothetical protein